MYDEYGLPDVPEMIHGDNMDDLIRQLQVRHLTHRGTDRILASELAKGGIYEDKYDKYAQLIDKAKNPDAAEEMVFGKYERVGPDDMYHSFLSLNVPHDISTNATKNLDSDRQAIMLMALRAGYEPDDAYLAALTKSPEEASVEIIKFLENTKGGSIKESLDEDEVLRVRFERLKNDD